MKALAITLGIVALASFGGCNLWYEWWYPREYEYALKLADDASLPEVKAQYLEQYLETIGKIDGPPRYVFTRPDLNLAKQKEILRAPVRTGQFLARNRR
jgi:hypothetical protein